MRSLKHLFERIKNLLELHTPQSLQKYKWPLISGCFMGCSFIPFPVFFMFFSVAPLWFFLYQQKKLKEVIVGSWVAQFVTTFIGFNWILYTAHEFGEMNWVFSFFVLILFCSLANLFIPIASVLWFWICQKRKLSAFSKLLLLPFLFIICHSYIPAIFPWNMGYPWLWGEFPAAQTAELWGFRFLNVLFYIFNLLILIISKHRFDLLGRIALIKMIGLFLFLNILGWSLKTRLPQPDSVLKTIVVQHNVGSSAHLKTKTKFRDPRKESLFRIKNLTVKSFIKYNKQKEKINFILWPEGAYPFLIHKNKARLPGISDLIEKMETPLITGGISRDFRGYSNSLVVLDRKGNIMKPIYDKVKLLAFGERFPGSQTLPFLLKLFPYFQSNLQPGTKHQVKNLEGVQLGFQICYESLFASFTRKLALDGSQVLINITNDSWYGSWQEPWQHFTMTLARAIETRRPLIRSTNTGISAAILADGTLQPFSPINKSWYYLYEIPYHKQAPKTLFMTWGFYIQEMFLLFLLMLIGLDLFYQKRKS
ncbi:MAG: apolipoprotein N-acyltransferase [Bdellovibrionales bacterium]